MVETGDTDDQEYVERITSNVDVKKDAWSETIDDMKAMAAELEAEGWDVFYVAAGHTAPETPEVGETDRYGLTHVIPDNYADGFVEAFEAGDYPEYDVFRQELSGTVFSVTVLRDPDSMTAILIASALTLSDAPEMINKSRSEGKTYTHVQTLDKTHLGSFEHEAPEKFFPNFEQYDAYLEHEE
jgi:hypothetical protein